MRQSRSQHSSICSVEGCERPWFCKTFCHFHYTAWTRGNSQDREKLKRAVENGTKVYPKWEYENPQGEAELAAMTERQEWERQHERQ
jgi:hypothetical protein